MYIFDVDSHQILSDYYQRQIYYIKYKYLQCNIIYVLYFSNINGRLGREFLLLIMDGLDVLNSLSLYAVVLLHHMVIMSNCK